MIVTILLLIKKLIEFARKYKSSEESLFIDLMELSEYSCDSLNSSKVMFLNCGSFCLSGNENAVGKNSFINRFMKRKRFESNCQRINSIKKMDNEEDRNREVLNGISAGLKGNLISPTSDCNSNNLKMPKENMCLCSTDSIHDCLDFLHDNSDYQWFLDYGYKDNNYSHHQSILSLSRSQDLFYYDDMARNIDANLAEVDMDDFNREDIHSVLSTLPNIPGAEEREMFASVSGSMMVKFDFESSLSPQNNIQDEKINCTSICKSQLLFSPVKESFLPNTNLSVDSLDVDNDINLMVTCQANKNNYTIAFEGSTILISDDSESRETGVTGDSSSIENEINRFENESKNNQSSSKNFDSNSGNVMVRSDSMFTTWSKIKENSNESLQLRRHPSGNNNTSSDTAQYSSEINKSGAVKSLSLPNLFRQKKRHNSGMSVSVKLNREQDNGSLNSEQRCIKLYDIQSTSNSKSVDHSSFSTSGKPPHNFSLVKLFIKQKSASHEGMSNYLEQTSSNSSWKSNRKCENENFEVQNGGFLKQNRFTGNINDINVVKTNKCSLIDCGDNLAHKIDVRNAKMVTSDKHKTQFVENNCEYSPDKYCSDESTQENGSNTESAENLTCNCINPRSNFGNKKLTEKSIQTSRLSESNENTQKKQMKVPIYILYPNYSLPNLEFLKKEHYVQNIDFSKVFLRPQKFKMSETPTSNSKTNKKAHGKRPFSVNDIETLKKTGFKHVKDWESLTFLLPKEYKQFLQEIPEIVAQLKDVKNTKEDLVPLFCLSPPPNRRIRKRPNSCDVNFFSNDCRGSNYSSTATQPSSGYRGSSTMLNSNNSNSSISQRNPSFGYKYDSGSESGISRRSGSLSQNKNYFANSGDPNDTPPPRPPLPRSILRNNSLDNQQYSCKTQKDNTNKRYSMVELSDKKLIIEEKSSRKRAVQNSQMKSPQKYVSRFSENKQLKESDLSPIKSSKCNQSEEHCSTERSNLENDMRRLEELLEISAVFGESLESFTECDMSKLRSQVSKFLTMQKNLEKVSETLQTVENPTEGKYGIHEETNTFEGNHSVTEISLHTPHNTPEHKKQQKIAQDHNKDFGNLLEYQAEGYSKPCNYNDHVHEFGVEDDLGFKEESMGGLKKTVSFAENISFAVKEQDTKIREGTPPNSPSFLLASHKNHQTKSKRPIDLPICEESVEGVVNNSPTKNLLRNSPELLHKKELIMDVKNAVEKILKLTNVNHEDPANVCLHHLCPSLFAVLSDGLKEELQTPFGPIRNSVWGVIEAASNQGPMTQTLNELVQRLNRDDIFTEGLIKFNAFIFGLLNARALSGWFTYMRTRDSLLRKYYVNTGLMLLSNTAGAPVRILVDQLVSILEPLASVQFNLDLMYQTKLLHCSLQNLNCLLEEPGNNDFLTPTKQFMLLKLVQSIQNSISQSGEAKKTKHILEDIEQKTTDPPLVNLLEKNKIRSRRGPNKARPRSGCDTVGTAQGIADVAGAMKKRWSGVHLNSKLVEAFDRLGDDSESDYTDSLDNTKPKREQKASPNKNVSKKGSSANCRTGDLESELDTKEKKKNILLNLNKKSFSKVENEKTDSKENKLLETSITQLQNGGKKFKSLQQKWERLSGRSASDSDSEAKSPFEGTPIRKANGAFSGSQTPEKQICDTNITIPSPTSRISKIPRLVTSPLSSSPNSKQTGNVKKLVSPTSFTHQNVGRTNNGTVKASDSESKISAPLSSRLSRCDDTNKTGAVSNSNVDRIQVARPTSLPYKGCNTMSTKKGEPISKRTSSMSLSRKPGLKKLHVQRTVRTLTHRLPSDSGHLSFNENEKLKVVLEVDKAWLLCCRGNQKGLVPKSAVISDTEDNKF